MNLSIDQRIDAAHSEAERIEQEARQIEARILKAGGVPPRRSYGRLVSGDDIAQNLTLRSQLKRLDPALAAYLGCGSDLHHREAEQRVAREMQAQAMQMQTDRLRQVNAASARYREHMNRQGVNPNTGRSWGC
jgi:hypothetical protein